MVRRCTTLCRPVTAAPTAARQQLQYSMRCLGPWRWANAGAARWRRGMRGHNPNRCRAGRRLRGWFRACQAAGRRAGARAVRKQGAAGQAPGRAWKAQGRARHQRQWRLLGGTIGSGTGSGRASSWPRGKGAIRGWMAAEQERRALLAVAVKVAWGTQAVRRPQPGHLLPLPLLLLVALRRLARLRATRARAGPHRPPRLPPPPHPARLAGPAAAGALCLHVRGGTSAWPGRPCRGRRCSGRTRASHWSWWSPCSECRRGQGGWRVV